MPTSFKNLKETLTLSSLIQKQPSRSVLEIATLLKSYFGIGVFIRTPFCKDTSGGLLFW